MRSHDYHILNMIGKVLAGPTAPTAIQFTSLPTCNLYQSCLECTTQIPGCVWCDSARKCTRKDGRDREWQKLEDALCYRPSHQVIIYVLLVRIIKIQYCTVNILCDVDIFLGGKRLAVQAESARV